MAIEYYQKAVDEDINKDHPDMIIEYANILVELQRQTQSEDLYKSVIKDSSKEWRFVSCNKLGNLYYQQKKYRDAESCYLQAITSKNI